MNTSDWIALIPPLLTVVGVVGGAVYMRGKLDAHATNASEKIDALGQKIDALEQAQARDGEAKGAQGVLNANAAAAAIEARTAREMAVAVDARQNAHERACNERQDRMERVIEGLTAQIRNLAIGLANNVSEIPPTRRAGG